MYFSKGSEIKFNSLNRFDVLTTCQPSTVWCSRERLPAAAAQLAQGSSEPVAHGLID
jgi:hypothetical protein